MFGLKVNSAKERLIRFFSEDKPKVETNFIEHFYGIKISEMDIKDFNEFSEVYNLRVNKMSLSKISKITNISKRKMEHWVYEGNFPFIIKLLDHYLLLGNPKPDTKWLSLNSTRGGLFTGPWIQVPIKINHKTLINFLNQLDKLSLLKEEKLDISNSFAYLLGMLVGDSSKKEIKRKQRTTRRIHVRLSKRFKSNERLGKFTSMCANRLGLRMNQYKDCPAGKCNVYPFYTWISQSSMLIQWMFDVGLGLRDEEKTTYNPIRADWILDTPKEFRISFLQGLADSDGFIDFSSQRAGIITEPNTELVESIFESLGIHVKKRFFTHNKLWSVLIDIKDAYNLPVFNPQVNSYRHKDLEKLFKAKRILGHWPEWLDIKVKDYIKEGFSGTKLIKKLLYEEGIVIRTKGIRRRIKNLEQNGKK